MTDDNKFGKKFTYMKILDKPKLQNHVHATMEA